MAVPIGRPAIYTDYWQELVEYEINKLNSTKSIDLDKVSQDILDVILKNDNYTIKIALERKRTTQELMIQYIKEQLGGKHEDSKVD